MDSACVIYVIAFEAIKKQTNCEKNKIYKTVTQNYH